MPTLDLDLVEDLRRALYEESLVLHYQPEVDLASGAIVGMEALLRWQHPGRGLLWPNEFLPVAEAAGLISKIGWWVLAHAVAECATWQRFPQHGEFRAQLWVNVSGSQLLEPKFCDRLIRLVQDAEVPAGVLGLEVTEEALGEGGSRVHRVLTALHDAGVALAVDDFGTWYSTLATIGELPVDAVKLDRSFVRGVGSDLEEDSIVASVIRLAHARDLYVVAEGVESWSEGARLCELGCDRALGYLFSGPQRAERARWMLTRGMGWTGVFGNGSIAGVVPGQRHHAPNSTAEARPRP